MKHIPNIIATIVVVALVLLSIWWAGERFDASPTMRDNLPSSDARPDERNGA